MYQKYYILALKKSKTNGVFRVVSFGEFGSWECASAWHIIGGQHISVK